MTAVDPQKLEFVFGTKSHGDTPWERAATSDRLYVRSQVQLAFDSERATGRRLNAAQALATFGLDKLEEVAREGVAGIVADPSQPADTFRKRRDFLKLSKQAVAAAAEVGIEDIEAAETAGSISSIQKLERLGQTLALDERLLGYQAEALGDKRLGARLRDLNLASDQREESFIIALADAAWVIGRQMEVSKALGADERLIEKFGIKSNDYKQPAYRVGYELAEKSREMLGLSPTEPIGSVRRLIEQRIGIPVVDAELGYTVAGATIINGKSHGIALGRAKLNASILVQRMTLAHELGHLLWDPLNKLERVRVEHTDQIGQKQQDPVEIRANAFAVAFLAPRSVVHAIYEKFGSHERAGRELAWQYGISATAAIAHIKATCELKPTSMKLDLSPEVHKKWDKIEATERPMSDRIPLSRRGRFAQLVLEAFGRNLITADTAAAWLRVDTTTLKSIASPPHSPRH
jgi:Zn-dependent peptidase ImmA (M78 family)